MPAIDIDPYSAAGGLFECVDCGGRTESERNPGTCSDCGGEVRNIAVSRE